MNFRHLDRMIKAASYDEIKIIGKDVELDGHLAHIIGMTLKDKKAFVYGLELLEHYDDTEENFCALADETHRKQMINNCNNEKNIVFLRVREFRSGGKVYEVAGADSSVTQNYNMAEHILFYLKIRECGWEIPGKSPLYTQNWENLQLSAIELKDEMEELPDWMTDLEIVTDSHSKTEVLEIPVTLTCGEQPAVSFKLKDGTQAECYINKICLSDVWADFEHRFEDEEYQKKVLKHISVTEFQKMKVDCEEALLAECPRGRCYILVEYECSADVALNFYAASYLDSKPQVHSGKASSLLIMHRPDKEVGLHGLKLRGCIIQTPVSTDTTELEAELFSYTEIVKQDVRKIY